MKIIFFETSVFTMPVLYLKKSDGRQRAAHYTGAKWFSFKAARRSLALAWYGRLIAICSRHWLELTMLYNELISRIFLFLFSYLSTLLKTNFDLTITGKFFRKIGKWKITKTMKQEEQRCMLHIKAKFKNSASFSLILSTLSQILFFLLHFNFVA